MAASNADFAMILFPPLLFVAAFVRLIAPCRSRGRYPACLARKLADDGRARPGQAR